MLSDAWYNANIANFPPIDQAILNALHTYGGIVEDLTNNGLWIDGTNDDRWSNADLQLLQTVPVSAFQVLNTIQPELSFTGPTSGLAGAPVDFTVQQTVTANTNFSINAYLGVSSDGGNTWSFVGSVPMDQNNRGPFALQWTPPSAGTYQVGVFYSNVYWIYPAQITFTATSTVPVTSRTVTSTQSGNWADPATWGGLTPPGAGDIAVIDNDVTITQNTTIGDGSNSTVLNVTNGALTVTGATLTIQGQSTFGGYNNGITVTRLTVESSGATPGGIVLDGNAGDAPIMSIGDDTAISFTGTSFNSCLCLHRVWDSRQSRLYH